MEDDLKINKNGRRPQKNKMEDNLKKRGRRQKRKKKKKKEDDKKNLDSS